VNATAPAEGEGWRDVWLDLLGFAGGLACAWWLRWETRDLVWSLWLASLTVGYAMICWSIFAPLVSLMREGCTGPAVAGLIGGLFMLVFFTVHFGLFHFVHSAFLNGFFPVHAGVREFPSLGLYAEVVRRYWWFVPMALLAEREAFRLPAQVPEPAAVAGRTGKRRGLDNVAQPYKNVVKLHLLIFFFAGAHFARLDSFIVYAAVYAVYFFPWRRVWRRAAGSRVAA